MSDALRELLASFVIEVDKAGELAKGNAAIDALKARLGDLQAEFNKVRAPAERAGKAIQAALQSGFGATPGLAAALEQRTQQTTSNLFGQFGAAQGAHDYSAPIGPHPLGPQFGPTRETLNAGRAAMAESEAAAAKYAQTLRGQLATAVLSLRRRAPDRAPDRRYQSVRVPGDRGRAQAFRCAGCDRAGADARAAFDPARWPGGCRRA